MKKSYSVEITQTLQRIIVLESDSVENAMLDIQRKFKNEEIVLDDNDYIHTDIRAYSDEEKLTTNSLITVNLTNSDLKAIETLLDYVIESEQTSYDEYLLEQFGKVSDGSHDDSYYSEINHIYAIAQRIKKIMSDNSN